MFGGPGAGASTWAFFTTNAGQVTNGDGAGIVALGPRSMAVNVGPNTAIPIIEWANIPLVNGQAYQLEAMAAIIYNPFSVAIKIDGGAQGIFPVDAPAFIRQWATTVTTFTFTGPTGNYSVGLYSDSGVAGGNDHTFDNFSLRSSTPNELCDCCSIDQPVRCWDDGVGGSGRAASMYCCLPPEGATYEIDWQYAHRARGGSGPETSELRIGDATNPLQTNPVVDTHLGVVGAWTVRSGTLPIGAGFPLLRFEFNSVGGAPGAGNLLDSCSVILRRVLPTPMNFGEQLVNGSFETPPVAPGSVNFPLTSTPGIGWTTTDPCTSGNCLEVWGTGFGGVPAHTGNALAEMNAYNRATLSQVAALETCINQIAWFDLATGDSVAPDSIVPCA